MFFFLQAPEGESQPSTEVDLFVSSEKIMVLNTDLQVGGSAPCSCSPGPALHSRLASDWILEV